MDAESSLIHTRNVDEIFDYFREEAEKGEKSFLSMKVISTHEPADALFDNNVNANITSNSNSSKRSLLKHCIDPGVDLSVVLELAWSLGVDRNFYLAPMDEIRFYARHDTTPNNSNANDNDNSEDSSKSASSACAGAALEPVLSITLQSVLRLDSPVFSSTNSKQQQQQQHQRDTTMFSNSSGFPSSSSSSSNRHGKARIRVPLSVVASSFLVCIYSSELRTRVVTAYIDTETMTVPRPDNNNNDNSFSLAKDFVVGDSKSLSTAVDGAVYARCRASRPSAVRRLDIDIALNCRSLFGFDGMQTPLGPESASSATATTLPPRPLEDVLAFRQIIERGVVVIQRCERPSLDYDSGLVPPATVLAPLSRAVPVAYDGTPVPGCVANTRDMEHGTVHLLLSVPLPRWVEEEAAAMETSSSVLTASGGAGGACFDVRVLLSQYSPLDSAAASAAITVSEAESRNDLLFFSGGESVHMYQRCVLRSGPIVLKSNVVDSDKNDTSAAAVQSFPRISDAELISAVLQRNLASSSLGRREQQRRKGQQNQQQQRNSLLNDIKPLPFFQPRLGHHAVQIRGGAAAPGQLITIVFDIDEKLMQQSVFNNSNINHGAINGTPAPSTAAAASVTPDSASREYAASSQTHDFLLPNALDRVDFFAFGRTERFHQDTARESLDCTVGCPLFAGCVRVPAPTTEGRYDVAYRSFDSAVHAPLVRAATRPPFFVRAAVANLRLVPRGEVESRLFPWLYSAPDYARWSDEPRLQLGDWKTREDAEQQQQSATAASRALVLADENDQQQQTEHQEQQEEQSRSKPLAEIGLWVEISVSFDIASREDTVVVTDSLSGELVCIVKPAEADPIFAAAIEQADTERLHFSDDAFNSARLGDSDCVTAMLRLDGKELRPLRGGAVFLHYHAARVGGGAVNRVGPLDLDDPQWALQLRTATPTVLPSYSLPAVVVESFEEIPINWPLTFRVGLPQEHRLRKLRATPSALVGFTRSTTPAANALVVVAGDHQHHEDEAAAAATPRPVPPPRTRPTSASTPNFPHPASVCSGDSFAAPLKPEAHAPIMAVVMGGSSPLPPASPGPNAIAAAASGTSPMPGLRPAPPARNGHATATTPSPAASRPTTAGQNRRATLTQNSNINNAEIESATAMPPIPQLLPPRPGSAFLPNPMRGDGNAGGARASGAAHVVSVLDLHDGHAATPSRVASPSQQRQLSELAPLPTRQGWDLLNNLVVTVQRIGDATAPITTSAPAVDIKQPPPVWITTTTDTDDWCSVFPGLPGPAFVRPVPCGATILTSARHLRLEFPPLQRPGRYAIRACILVPSSSLLADDPFRPVLLSPHERAGQLLRSPFIVRVVSEAVFTVSAGHQLQPLLLPSSLRSSPTPQQQTAAGYVRDAANNGPMAPTMPFGVLPPPEEAGPLCLCTDLRRNEARARTRVAHPRLVAAAATAATQQEKQQQSSSKSNSRPASSVNRGEGAATPAATATATNAATSDAPVDTMRLSRPASAMTAATATAAATIPSTAMTSLYTRAAMFEPPMTTLIPFKQGLVHGFIAGPRQVTTRDCIVVTVHIRSSGGNNNNNDASVEDSYRAARDDVLIIVDDEWQTVVAHRLLLDGSTRSPGNYQLVTVSTAPAPEPGTYFAVLFSVALGAGVLAHGPITVIDPPSSSATTTTTDAVPPLLLDDADKPTAILAEHALRSYFAKSLADPLPPVLHARMAALRKQAEADADEKRRREESELAVSGFICGPGSPPPGPMATDAAGAMLMIKSTASASPSRTQRRQHHQEDEAEGAKIHDGLNNDNDTTACRLCGGTGHSLPRTGAMKALLVGCSYTTGSAAGTAGYAGKGCCGTRDVELLQQALRSAWGDGVSSLEVVALKDPRRGDDDDVSNSSNNHGGTPTAFNIRAQMMSLIKRAQYGDAILFYFSGFGAVLHGRGTTDPLRHVLVPSDVDWAHRLIDLREVDTFARRAAAKVGPTGSVSIVLDCGFERGVFDEMDYVSATTTTGPPVSRAPNPSSYCGTPLRSEAQATTPTTTTPQTTTPRPPSAGSILAQQQIARKHRQLRAGVLPVSPAAFRDAKERLLTERAAEAQRRVEEAQREMEEVLRSRNSDPARTHTANGTPRHIFHPHSSTLTSAGGRVEIESPSRTHAATMRQRALAHIPLGARWKSLAAPAHLRAGLCDYNTVSRRMQARGGEVLDGLLQCARFRVGGAVSMAVDVSGVFVDSATAATTDGNNNSKNRGTLLTPCESAPIAVYFAGRRAVWQRPVSFPGQWLDGPAADGADEACSVFQSALSDAMQLWRMSALRHPTADNNKVGAPPSGLLPHEVLAWESAMMLAQPDRLRDFDSIARPPTWAELHRVIRRKIWGSPFRSQKPQLFVSHPMLLESESGMFPIKCVYATTTVTGRV